MTMPDMSFNPMEMSLREQAREIGLLTAEINRLRASPKLGSEPDYRVTLDEIRLLVAKHVPSGSVVAVVSRGDEEILKLNGLRTRHFPCDDNGIWSGQYPAEGAEAVAELLKVRRRGARYLLIPWTAFWWLEFYPAFAAQLDRHAVLACRDGSCLLYDLCPAQLTPITESRDAFRHTIELLDALVPAGASTVVLVSGAANRCVPASRPVILLDPEPSETVTWPELLRYLRASGARCFAILDIPFNRNCKIAAFRREASTHFRLIASRAGVCDLFDLTTEAPQTR